MSEKKHYCPACRESNMSEVVSLDDRRLQLYSEFSEIKYSGLIDSWIDKIDIAIDKCDSCGHHRYRDFPTNEMLSKMYASGKSLKPHKDDIKRQPTMTMIAEMERLKNISIPKSPKLLDYGSGFGRWARASVKAGFEVTAYEPSHNRAHEKERVDFILINDLTEIQGQKFDVINLEQVLEHIPEPLELLKDLHKFCLPETILRISVPNLLRCPEGKHLWRDWPYDGIRVHTMAPFEHLHGFTPTSLKRLTSLAGFKKINNFSVWAHYPTEMLRNFVSKLLPKIGQTFLLLKIKG